MRSLFGSLILASSVMMTGCFDEELSLHGKSPTLELTARKDYRPSRWTDGNHSFEKDTKFEIPAKLDVVSGTSGNHKGYLFFKKGREKAESRCEYKGGSAQANPKGQRELDKGRAYHLVKCDGGLKAGSIALAKDLRLRVDHGGNEKESPFTLIRATILYEGARPTPAPSPTPIATSTPPPAPTASPTPDIFAGLPPDPGEAGKATLVGVDADGDGVRDDIQRWFVQYLPNVPGVRALARSRHVKFQEKLKAKQEGGDGVSQAIAAAQLEVCLSRKISTFGNISRGDARKLLNELGALEINTRERFEASFAVTKSLSGGSIDIPTPEQCDSM